MQGEWVCCWIRYKSGVIQIKHGSRNGRLKGLAGKVKRSVMIGCGAEGRRMQHNSVEARVCDC
jgi:hypothetical protein